MAKFTPTDEQREDIAIMSAGRLSQEEMAKSIINPRTGRPISVKVLCRVFKNELAEDAEFKKLILEKFKEQVDAGNWRAIQYGMDHIVGFANGTATAAATPNGPDAITAGITVRFVKPDSSNDPPIDVTPPRPAPLWPKNLKPPEAPRQSPIISSDDENAIAPIYKEVTPAPVLEPLDNPKTAEQLLFQPLRGQYRTELDLECDALKPWHKRKLTGRLAKGSLVWGGKPRKGFP